MVGVVFCTEIIIIIHRGKKAADYTCGGLESLLMGCQATVDVMMSENTYKSMCRVSSVPG